MAATAKNFGDAVGKPRLPSSSMGKAEFRSTIHLVLEPAHSTLSVYGGCALSFDSRRWLNAKSADEHQRTVTNRCTGTRLMLSAPTSGDAESESSGPRCKSNPSVRVQAFFWRDISRKGIHPGPPFSSSLKNARTPRSIVAIDIARVVDLGRETILTRRWKWRRRETPLRRSESLGTDFLTSGVASSPWFSNLCSGFPYQGRTSKRSRNSEDDIDSALVITTTNDSTEAAVASSPSSSNPYSGSPNRGSASMVLHLSGEDGIPVSCSPLLTPAQLNSKSVEKRDAEPGSSRSRR
ncbi:uncharacterized protein FOMMEDRAFT_161950 [Fomitiporia mediterranea MF3/22]|uniref:uncharacterized protein n=1 Tax=Fomitiporia mediterranea (strain MF3/22) TaxID=694068 RepID=UPI000440910F|nr:uncharacterized protein FOMMEDRAFT_161950 [Fomitiporia mediterranea MF3/22]EJC98198.1 hypothetical protein FOMMEDRAFT_161950 [Fomitiporia mediterranea MF3/22]